MTVPRRGVDLSSNNAHPINWDLLARSVDVVWIKATQYLGYINPCLWADATAAKAHGLEVWLYHFAGNAPNVQIGTPEAEADHFLAVAQHIPHDGLCLDYEPVGIPTNPGWVQAFMDRSGAGMLYSYTSRIVMLGNVSRAARRWVAAYQVSQPVGMWDAWQYTDNGVLPGVAGRVDLSHVYWPAAAPPAPPAPPTPPPKEITVTTATEHLVVVPALDGNGNGYVDSPPIAGIALGPFYNGTAGDASDPAHLYDELPVEVRAPASYRYGPVLRIEIQGGKAMAGKGPFAYRVVDLAP